MTAVPLFYGRVNHDGKVVFDNPLIWGRHVQTLRGQQIEVTIRKRRTQRSLKQNRYYWSVVIPSIAEHCGYSKDEAHEACAFKFLRIGEPDAALPARRSTASLTVQEFQDYCETVKRFAAEELDIVIPDPNTVDI